MKTLLLLAVIAVSGAAHAGCVTSTPNCVAKPAPAAASAPTITRANAGLQAACTDKLKPMLTGAERIRDMNLAPGQVEANVTFRVSANGDKKSKTFVCSVQRDGSLKIVSKG